MNTNINNENLNKSYIKIPFNWKIIIFLVILEVLTVPLVAISNNIVIKNYVYVLLMGFIVAAFALFIIMKLIIFPIKNYFAGLIGQKILKIHGALYIGLLAGFLLMFMFFVQELTYKFTNSDCIVGFVSAFFSVGISLIIYSIFSKFFNFGLKIFTENKQYLLLLIPMKDIIALTLLFSIYETIASPLSILWVPHLDHRFVWGIISGVVSGVVGGTPLVIISFILNYKITINLKILKNLV